jgi:hypothetical protein
MLSKHKGRKEYSECGSVRIGDDPTLEQTMPVLSGLALARATHKKASQRAVGYGHAHWTGRCEIT